MHSTLPCLMVIFLPFLFMTNPSLIFLWIILEMSSIMFICMALSEEEMTKKECLLMYFLIQSFASALLLICLFSWMLTSKNLTLENSNNMSMMITILIALKIAMGPLHFWLVKMCKLISWFVMGILLTWQKIIPLTFFSSFSMNLLLAMMCITSLLVGTLSQLKMTSLKMLIVASSISHLGWMVYPSLKSSIVVMSYLLIYSLILLPMITLFFYSNYQYLFNQINYKMVAYLSLLIFSLAGIPPLAGFLLKWMSLSSMMESIFIMMTFSLMACLSFFIYIRMMYKSLLMAPFSLKQTNLMNNVKWIWTLNFFLPILSIA